jgi:cell wall-associated NlpC family hydrolase
VASGRELSGLAVGALGIGSLFVYGGVTGRSPLATLRTIIQGQAPTATAIGTPIVVPAAPVATPGGPGPSGSGRGGRPGVSPLTGSSIGAQIANDAQRFVGAGYVFGGAPAKGVGNWDCSSFVNYVVGFDVGLAIPRYPAGHYDGSTHGPVTMEWFAWIGAVTVSTNGDDALPGDLCCWQTHMGIAIGGGQMVSARSAHSSPPTGINKINGDIPGEILHIRRLKGI